MCCKFSNCAFEGSQDYHPWKQWKERQYTILVSFRGKNEYFRLTATELRTFWKLELSQCNKLPCWWWLMSLSGELIYSHDFNYEILILRAKSAIPTRNHKSVHPQTCQTFIISKTEMTALIPMTSFSSNILHLNKRHCHPPGGPSQTPRSQGWPLPYPSVTKSNHFHHFNITQNHPPFHPHCSQFSSISSFPLGIALITSWVISLPSSCLLFTAAWLS